MSLHGARRSADRAGRSVRESVVWTQYESREAAASYAASHEGDGPSARYFHSRMHAIEQSLGEHRGGDLLDVGCGPGMLVRHLLDTRGGDLRITACDQSPAMVDAARERVGDIARLQVARAECLPFPDASFDVVLAMGVLEYTDASCALREAARVLRPNGLLLATMLNPLSPYRLFEWVLYWPAVRLLGRLERVAGVPPERRHGVRTSGIRAVPPRRLRGKMRGVGLAPDDVIHYDLTLLLPPFDKFVRRRTRSWRTHPERTIGRGVRGWMGTAYLVAARRT